MIGHTRIGYKDQPFTPYPSIQFPHTLDVLRNLAPSEKKEFPLIKASFSTRFNQGPNFRAFFLFIEETIATIIPKEILSILSTAPSIGAVESSVALLNQKLPLLTWSETPSKICVSLLSSADYAHDVGRYATDVLCRWLIPGKFLNVLSTQALNFQFYSYPDQNFFFYQVLLDIGDSMEADDSRAHWTKVATTIRLNLLAIQNARKVDRDIFSEIQHFSLLFRDYFTALRDLRHISRLISFQYLFRKRLLHQVMISPKERHLSLKFLTTHLHFDSGPRKVVGVLIGINVFRENEFFEERHILSAIGHCLKTLRVVPDSLITDRRSQDKIRLFYLEVEKENREPISLDEIRFLKKHLPRELNGHFENVIHPVFMPRNEEEVMRNIVILSQQLKYIGDIPQVIISFEAQIEHDLSFRVVLLRLLRPKSLPLEEIFTQSKTFLKLLDHEVKHVGRIRKKHIKEAHVFRILTDKKHFLRKDYSLDLFKARQAISIELCRILGDIRDFNGGILSKQHEVFHKLKKLLLEAGHSNDFLLENFFYSISPPLMQSILSPPLLQTLFLMALEALEHSYAKESCFFKVHCDAENMLVLIGSRDRSLRERIYAHLNTLKIPASTLTSASIEAYEITCLGLIYRCAEKSQRSLFEITLQGALYQF